MPEMFHFQHPLWLLTLLPLALLIWWIRDPASHDGAWQRICDARLLPYLLINQPHARHRLPVWLLAAGWLVTVVALADPVWEKQPQPVFRSEAARVVVLDLSRSMEAPDLAPSRLERARYKVEDVLRRSQEGQVGLVVFAGDAFVVSPLTNDAKTITELLQALEPGLMPVQGSRADLGLHKAGELLKQAGVARGQILLVTDGDEGGQAIDAARDLKRQGYTVSVLGVGTKQGAPLPDGKGGYVHDAAGAIVVPRLDVASLRALATAGGGRYATITGNDADLDALLTPMAPRLDTKVEQSGLKTDVWVSHGPWLVLLLLPLAALAFRRGWLLVLVLLVAGTVSTPESARAASWNDLWVRPDQQAAQALAGGDNARAAELATDPSQRGTAEYRAGHYEQALRDFSRASGTDAEYNRGNALARLGHYKEALAAYDKALAAQPGMEDALHNKAAVEALLRQQKKKQQRQQQGPQQDKQQGKQGSQQHQQTGKNGSQHSQSQGKQASSQDRQQGKQSGANPSQSSQTNAKGGGAAARQEAKGASPKADKGKKDASTQSAKAGESRASNAKQQASAEAGHSGSQHTVDNTPPAGQSVAAQNTDENPPAEAKSKARAQERPGKNAAASQPPTQSRADQEMAKNPESPGAPAATDTQTSEEQQAMQQWLRRIPDDPGGLLRRKFLYQYRQRAAATGPSDSQSW